MAKNGVILLALLLGVCWAAPAAQADKYDLKLERLYKRNESGAWVKRGENFFSDLMGDMGSALAPRFLGPASTTGSLGFQIGLNMAFTNIDENAEYWKAVVTPYDDMGNSIANNPAGPGAEGADSYLTTWQVYARKGLPFSLEVGGTITGLAKSSLVGVGLELKWSALEGFKKLPEIAFRGAVSTFLGTEDYSLLLASGDIMISKDIPIAGLFVLSPYLGYEFLYVHGSSNVVPLVAKADPNSTPATGTAVPFVVDEQGVFLPANVYRHYIVLGVTMIATVVNVGFDYSVAPADAKQHSFSLRLGVDF